MPTIHCKPIPHGIKRMFSIGRWHALRLVRTMLLSIFFLTASSQNKNDAPRGGSSIAAHFHHVHVNSTHPEKTIAFYEKFFGAARIKYRDRSPALLTERSFMLIDSVTTAPPTNLGSSLWHIGWAGVDGPAEYRSRVRKGIAVEMPPDSLKLPDLPDPVYWMYFRGPSREIIEVSTSSQNHRFEHIHLLSSDIERSTKWFKDNLGLTPTFNKAIDFYGLLMNSFMVDNVNIILFSKPLPGAKSMLLPDEVYPKNGFKVTDGAAIGHLGFSYRSIGPVFERMKAFGVVIVKKIGFDERHGMKNFFVRGPDGLLVEIVEEYAIPYGIWQK